MLVEDEAIVKLFVALATWDADHGLNVELGMWSPRDTEHCQVRKHYLESRPSVDS